MQVIDSSQVRFQGRLSDSSMQRYKPENMKELLFNDMDRLVRESSPDLIIITGDITYGEFDDKGTSLIAFINKMEEYGIPWAPVWGNHDNESVLGVDWQCAQFEKAAHCFFKKGSTVGCGNYTIGIKNEAGELIRLLYMMDSNGCGHASALSIAQGVKTAAGLTLEQLEWLEENYKAVCQKYGRKVPSFVCLHIEPEDFLTILENKEYFNQDFKRVEIVSDSGDFGSIHETIFGGRNMPSVLPVFRKVGVDGVFFGHSHVNDASVISDGIRWTYGLKTGAYDYHEKEKLGGLLITVSNKGRTFSVEHKKI